MGIQNKRYCHSYYWQMVGIEQKLIKPMSSIKNSGLKVASLQKNMWLCVIPHWEKKNCSIAIMVQIRLVSSSWLDHEECKLNLLTTMVSQSTYQLKNLLQFSRKILVGCSMNWVRKGKHHSSQTSSNALVSVILVKMVLKHSEKVWKCLPSWFGALYGKKDWHSKFYVTCYHHGMDMSLDLSDVPKLILILEKPYLLTRKLYLFIIRIAI